MVFISKIASWENYAQWLSSNKILELASTCSGVYWKTSITKQFNWQPDYISMQTWPYAGIILFMRSPNERRRYTVTPSLIGWAHTQNDPCMIRKPTRGSKQNTNINTSTHNSCRTSSSMRYIKLTISLCVISSVTISTEIQMPFDCINI